MKFKLLLCCLISLPLISCNRGVPGCVVTFNTNGGSKIDSQTVQKGDKIKKPDDPTKNGYTFVKWTYQEEDWSFIGYVVTEDMTLDAVWSDPIVYSITYDLNGGVLTSQNPSTYTVEDEFQLNSPYRSEYTFKGWKLNDDLVFQINKGTFGDLTLIAQWSRNSQEYELMPEIIGGTDEEQKAILEVLNNKPICIKNGTSSSEILYDSYVSLEEDEGDCVKLSVKQIYSGKTVDITWGLDESQTYFGGWLKPETDDTHWFIQPDYKGYGVADGSLSWKITKMECGEAHTIGDVVSYSARVKNEMYFHEDKTIDWCYQFSDEVLEKTVGETQYRFPSTFNVVDYSDAKVDSKGKLQPYYKTNNPDATEKQYFYVNVTGKVIFLAPDGNFALIADGDNVMEIYAGAGVPLKESNYPNLKLGAVVKVSGNLTQYCGSIHLGFVTKILQGDINAITTPCDPLIFRELTEMKIASLTKATFVDQSQAVKVDDVHMQCSLRSVRGTLVPGSIKFCSGSMPSPSDWIDATPDTIQKGRRFSFKLQVGEEQHTIMFDFHIVRNDSVTQLFENLKAALRSGLEIAIKGFSRYFGSDANPFNQEGSGGRWTLLPFASDHVSVAA